MISNHYGYIDGLDFGCGQYYYTDIPNWQKYFSRDYFTSNHPFILFISLFFIWGFLMVKLWIWIDKRYTNK